MNTIYLIGSIVIGIVAIATFYYYHNSVEKSTFITQDNLPKVDFEASQLKVNSSEGDKATSKDNIVEEQIKSVIATKNKWLYPTDGFGKMEEGRNQ